MPSVPPIVLTFAASDPTGGAGLQADLLTLASMGCHPLSVITAITVQDSLGVEGVLAIDAEYGAPPTQNDDEPKTGQGVVLMGSRATLELTERVELGEARTFAATI